jgi:hypothetical protein
VYCIDDSEKMRERQCRCCWSKGCWSIGIQWEVSLLRLSRSVESRFLDLNGEGKDVYGWNVSGTQEHRHRLHLVCIYGVNHPG